MSSLPSPQTPNGSMAEVLESALLAALKPLSNQLQNLNNQVEQQKQEIQLLRNENQSLKAQIETQQQTMQTEVGGSLKSLLDSLKTFNERLDKNETQTGRLTSQQQQMQSLIRAIDRKLPTAFDLPRQLTLGGETISYRKLLFILLMLIGCIGSITWLTEQAFINKTNQIYIQTDQTYKRVNSLDIRLKRLEQRLK